MHRHALLTIAIVCTLLVGATGIAMAQPGNGPPDELPSPVPEFVSDVLGTIGDFVAAVLDSLEGAMGSLGEAIATSTPDGDHELAVDQ